MAGTTGGDPWSSKSSGGNARTRLEKRTRSSQVGPSMFLQSKTLILAEKTVNLGGGAQYDPRLARRVLTRQAARGSLQTPDCSGDPRAQHPWQRPPVSTVAEDYRVELG